MEAKVTKQQIPVIAARLVEFQEGFSDLSKGGGQYVIQNTKEAVESMIEGVESMMDREKRRLLKHRQTIVIPASTEKFVVKDNFIVDNALVKISGVGNNVKEWFWDKTEEPSPLSSAIDLDELLKSSTDDLIIEGLGGKEIIPVTMKEIYRFMKSGKMDKKKWYIFYVSDVNGILRAVFVFWDGFGWFVSADSVESPAEWNAGVLVASRNSEILILEL